MKTLLPSVWAVGLVAAITLLPATSVLADPMADICRERAERASGYTARAGLTKQVGNVQFRLSGSVALGFSRSSGAAGGTDAPAFAGQAATERRQMRAESKYSRVYADCMRAR